MDPTEHIHEHLQHTVAHGDEHDGHDEHGGHGEHGGGGHGNHGGRWITAAALTAAILAAFAAVSGALSNSHLTESTHRRIDANDQWAYYQSKSIKSAIIDSRIFAASIAHIPTPKKDIAKKAQYDEDLPKTKEFADALTVISDQHVSIHERYEAAETMFHISIAVVAIAVVAKRRSFWYVSMVTGIVGLFFFGKAYSTHVNTEPEDPAAASAATAPATPGEAAATSKSIVSEHVTTAASKPAIETH